MSLRSRRASSTSRQIPVATSADDSNSSGITRFAQGASGSEWRTSSIDPASSSVPASSSMYSSSTPIVSAGPEPYVWSCTLPRLPAVPLPPFPVALTDASVAAASGGGKRAGSADDECADAETGRADGEHRRAQRGGEEQGRDDRRGAA